MPHPYPTHAKILTPGEVNPYGCNMCMVEPTMFNAMVEALRTDDQAAKLVELQNENVRLSIEVQRLQADVAKDRKAIRAGILAELRSRLEE